MTDAVRTEPEPGLRERKRRDTRRRIVLAAVRLVEERGMDGATVDEISREADISPRTFFNYFPSKEEAVAGDGPALPDAASVDRFVAARGPLLDDLAELVVDSSDEALNDVELTRSRLALVKQYPHLVSLRMARMRHLEDELTVATERRLLAQQPELADRADELRDRAAVLVYAFTGVLRHAWLNWAHGDDTVPLPVLLRRSCALLDDVLGSASTR